MDDSVSLQHSLSKVQITWAHAKFVSSCIADSHAAVQLRLELTTSVCTQSLGRDAIAFFLDDLLVQFLEQRRDRSEFLSGRDLTRLPFKFD